MGDGLLAEIANVKCWWHWLHKNMSFKSSLSCLAPGIGVVAITSLAAMFLSEHYSTPVMLLALLLGISVAFLYEETPSRHGIDFAAGTLLRFGVALIGLRIAITDLIGLGYQTGVLIALAVASTLLFGIILCRLLGMSKYFGALSGGAVGICGASAALALSSVLPDNEHKGRDTLLTVIAVTVLSTIAMIVYPIIAAALDMNTLETSLFLGATIHDVAQVVGAGYSISSETGDLAALIKLVRVSLLIPVVLIFVLVIRKRRKDGLQESSSTILPWFLVAFTLLMLINSVFSIPEAVTEATSAVSRFALVMAITAIGMKSNLRQLLQVGVKPLLVIAAETIWIAALILGYILLF